MSSGGGWRGAMAPWSSMAAKLAATVVVASIVASLTRASGLVFLLSPDHVLSGFALWQPFTYIFVEGSPAGVLIDALIIWSIGGALEAQWGGRRLFVMGAGVTFVAGLLTVALALLLPSMRLNGYFGGTALASALWVAYGLSFGAAQTSFWGIPMTGNGLAAVGAGFIVVNAAFAGWQAVVPDAFSVALTFAILRIKGPRLWVLRFQSWRLHRQLRGRSKHLKVIAQDRNTSRSSDRFLH